MCEPDLDADEREGGRAVLVGGDDVADEAGRGASAQQGVGFVDVAARFR
ncbi:hypothetical protein [Nocardia farcinica]